MVAERKVRERKKGGKKEKGKKVKRNETNTNCTSRWLPRSPLRVIEYSTSKESCRSTDTHVCRKSAGILLPGNLGTINRSILSLSLSLGFIPSDLDRIRFYSFLFFLPSELGLESDYAAVINIVEDYNFEI